MNRKKSKISMIPKAVWLLISFLAAIALWFFISGTPAGGVVFASPRAVLRTLSNTIDNGTLFRHIQISLRRILMGFGLGFIAAIPVAFLMGWYEVFRNLFEPWIQFVRSIPPLAYIPLVIVAAGVGERSNILVIFIASFLVMVIAIYQGVCNVDTTLIKAAKVLGARDRDIFIKIVIPASTPFILVAARLGLSTSLTTLIAAELTGASWGLGMMIQRASGFFDMATVLMGIIIIGIMGITFEKIVKLLERKLTGWQETISQ